MRMFLFVLGVSASVSSLLAQAPLKNAASVFSYHIRSEGGTNACAVTYNPDTRLYYTAFAGNAAFPLEAFDESGQNRYTGEVGADIRSLWYDAKSRSLQGLAYPQKGKFAIGLDASGLPVSLKEPGERTVASISSPQSTASPAGKLGLLLFDGSTVHRLHPSSLKQKGTIVPKNLPVSAQNLNYTTVVYTGVKGYELGFYDPNDSKIYFTDAKGEYTGTTRLPSDAPQATAFRLSYANGRLWLFDADERTWFAYRLF